MTVTNESSPASPAAGSRTRLTAILLTFFLGGLGVHKFYLGKTLAGVLYLLFCWTMIPSLIAFVEFILFLLMSDEKFNEKYNQPPVAEG